MILNSKVTATFYIYDYETFGTSPSMDRPSQFAGVRTDMDFNIVQKPLVIYCAPANDYLPDPEAVLITGITPQQALTKGVNEADFARQIHQVFSIPDTCIMGYNNIRFDDEVSRNIFYRSFYDPYAYSWQNSNSRWDLLDVMRACYALRPEGIVWPKNKDGFPSFRLEHLTRANGIEHNQAHDAMSDVYATIAMAKLVKQVQPRLFNFLLTYRNKHKLCTLIDTIKLMPLVYVSGIFGAARGNTSWVVPLAWHPVNKNAVIMCELSSDLTPLLTLNIDQLRDLLYTRDASRTVTQLPIPLQLIHINKCPVLAPARVLLPENAKRLGLDRQVCWQNLQLLREYPQVQGKVAALFAEAKPYKGGDDVDAQLYNGFFTGSDKKAIKKIQETRPQDLPALHLDYSDGRIKELLFRFRARNYPNTLNAAEQKDWLQHRQNILSVERVQKYLLQLEALYNQYASNKAKTVLINALFEYVLELTSDLT